MALADILRRIEHDADAESAQVIEAAEAAADALRKEAEKAADAASEAAIARARAEVVEEGRVRVASARLGGRDRILAEKRVMIGRVLGEVEKRILALGDAEYAALLAAEVARNARGGETLLYGSADAVRLGEHLPAALKAAGVTVDVSDTPADIDRGVVIAAERMRVEVSVASLLHGRREELETLASNELFGTEG